MYQRKNLKLVKNNAEMLRDKWNGTHQIFEFPEMGLSNLKYGNVEG